MEGGRKRREMRGRVERQGKNEGKEKEEKNVDARQEEVI